MANKLHNDISWESFLGGRGQKRKDEMEKIFRFTESMCVAFSEGFNCKKKEFCPDSWAVPFNQLYLKENFMKTQLIYSYQVIYNSFLELIWYLHADLTENDRNAVSRSWNKANGETGVELILDLERLARRRTKKRKKKEQKPCSLSLASPAHLSGKGMWCKATLHTVEDILAWEGGICRPYLRFGVMGYRAKKNRLPYLRVPPRAQADGFDFW